MDYQIEEVEELDEEQQEERQEEKTSTQEELAKWRKIKDEVAKNVKEYQEENVYEDGPEYKFGHADQFEGKSKEDMTPEELKEAFKKFIGENPEEMQAHGRGR